MSNSTRGELNVYLLRILKEMAENKRQRTGGQALGKAIRQGSGKPYKSGGEESDRGEVWVGKERLRDKPDQGKALKTPAGRVSPPSS